jgi:hypothetical protein
VPTAGNILSSNQSKLGEEKHSHTAACFTDHELACHLKETQRWKMLDQERELISKAEREKLLRQVEEGLAHSREIIAHIREVLTQRCKR